jgi:hypothetical protein
MPLFRIAGVVAVLLVVASAVSFRLPFDFRSGHAELGRGAKAEATSRTEGIAVEVLKPVAALPAHIAGTFRELTTCQQSPSGDYFVFDRRAHSVFVVTPGMDAARKLIEIGSEAGRVLDPSAFDLAPEGSFAVADAPSGRPRIQLFLASGATLNGFFLPGTAPPRIILRNLVLSGLHGIEFTGRSIFLSQPELGAVVAEYAPDGRTIRTFGSLRHTGHEADANIHLALNSGLVIVNPAGGFYFVFLAGLPLFRKYDAAGALVFERHIEGVEVDQFIQNLPTTWKRHRTEEGELPLVLPSVHAAAADRDGNLWISLAVGTTYVFDANGDKVRAVQFRAAGAIAPTGMSFTPNGRVLVTPGCFAFAAQ